MSGLQLAVDRLINEKLRFCPDGICDYCGADLCKDLDLDDDKPITCCWKCRRSFVE